MSKPIDQQRPLTTFGCAFVLAMMFVSAASAMIFGHTMAALIILTVRP